MSRPRSITAHQRPSARRKTEPSPAPRREALDLSDVGRGRNDSTVAPAGRVLGYHAGGYEDHLRKGAVVALRLTAPTVPVVSVQLGRVGGSALGRAVELEEEAKVGPA